MEKGSGELGVGGMGLRRKACVLAGSCYVHRHMYIFTNIYKNLYIYIEIYMSMHFLM